MPEVPLIEQLAQHGGYALLAGFCCYLLYRQGEARAADQKSQTEARAAELKEGRERERDARLSSDALHSRTLDVLSELKQSIATMFTFLDETWDGTDRRRRGGRGDHGSQG